MASPESAPVTQFGGSAERVYGPPGTGKTTDLARQVAEFVTEHGAESTMVASFSTTAANEIGGRFSGAGIRPNKRLIGTLHSHAFKAIGHGTMALDVKTIKNWNDLHPGEWKITPDVRGSGGGRTGDSGRPVADPSQAVTGDQLLSCLDKLRAAMIPAEDWPTNIRRFSRDWNAWKDEAEAVDYTDMIEFAYLRARDGEAAPGRPKFLIADEAQDMTPLEVALTLAWGEQADHLVIGMDDDQAINRWRGGDPAPLLGLTGEGVTDRVLEQSYRIPGSVHRVAEHWIKKLSLRRPKIYRPRMDDEGQPVEGAAYCVPETIQDGGLVRRIGEDLAAGNSVMVMSSCNYMLEPLTKRLRTEGIPFHNPFRPAEGRWNPLRPSGVGMSTAERVYRFMIMDERNEGTEHFRMWTGADVKAWVEMVKLTSANMVRGAKTLVDDLDDDTEVPFDVIDSLFASTPEGRAALARATRPDPSWLGGVLLKQKTEVAAYPLTVARLHGPGALAQEPELFLGTIHSFKGAACDIVYVDPGISTAAMRNASTVDGRDEIIRLFYVAMTRARKQLRLLHPVTDLHVNRRDLLPTNLEVTAA
jgi:DNA helicase-2/ATP-dependent DNA helicase PcrA